VEETIMHDNLSRFIFAFLIFLCARSLSAQQVEPQRRLGAPQASIVGGKEGCPVTKAPDPLFVPPQPYSATAGSDEFLYGSTALWTLVFPGWHVHSGGKLPFFSQGYDWKKGGRPRLTVVARRLDGEGPLVWSELASSGLVEGQGLEGMFMVTGIDIPSSGCWEIGAQYVDTSRDVHTLAGLAYTVWVEP
jgi:hypothetical protein